jgi:hypothetical protein
MWSCRFEASRAIAKWAGVAAMRPSACRLAALGNEPSAQRWCTSLTCICAASQQLATQLEDRHRNRPAPVAATALWVCRRTSCRQIGSLGGSHHVVLNEGGTTW